MALRVHHLNCGTMRPPSARLITGTGGLLAAARLVCHCLLLETEDGLALVDTGFGLADIADPVPRVGRGLLALVRPVLDPSETAIEQLRARGLDPADVRHIVVTHLDPDHAGGLADFPRAQVHVSRPMLDVAVPRVRLRYRGRLRPAQWQHQPRWAPISPYAAQFLGLPSVTLPFGGGDVRVVPLEGHVRGHLGVAVRRADGPTPWLLHVGDAAFAARSLTGVPAPLGLRVFEAAMRTDTAAWRRTRAHLVDLARRRAGEVEIVTAHDFDQLPPMTKPDGIREIG